MSAQLKLSPGARVREMQELIAEIGRLRIENERLNQRNFMLTRRLRAANTQRSLLRRRPRNLP